MKLENILYKNEIIEDRETFDLLPNELKELYLKFNGLVALDGGIQFRGCLKNPNWISLYEIWKGNANLYSVYQEITTDDIPIAQDAFGDQYIYRKALIYRLYSESGELENLNCTLNQFLKNIEKDPIDYLSLQQIYDLKQRGIKLRLGEMMNVYPPFLINYESERSYKPIPSQEQIAFLKDIYKQTKNLKDGTQVNFELKQ